MSEYHILNDDEFNSRETLNSQPANISYSPWCILEHLNVAQRGILEFIRNPAHVFPQWPIGYWLNPAEAADQDQWDQTISSFLSDIQALRDIVADPNTELYAPIPHAPVSTIFSEILVVADHNAYHIGEFASLRQVMSTW